MARAISPCVCAPSSLDVRTGRLQQHLIHQRYLLTVFLASAFNRPHLSVSPPLLQFQIVSSAKTLICLPSADN
ncbi:hypothetical protein IG631_16186 [Alternaria alternata]|nr:hypothetical protein IG631_16186 [Alternaria alternata]